MIVRKILAALVGMIFVSLAVPFALMWNSFATFLDQDFYEGEFVDQLYNFALEGVPEVASSDDLNSVEDNFFAAFSEEELREIFEKIFTKDDFRGFVGDVFNELSTIEAGLDGQSQLRIPLAIVADKGDVLADVLIEHYLEVFPECEEENIDVNFSDFECIPIGLSRDDLHAMLALELDLRVFSEIDDYYVVDLNVRLPEKFEGDILSYVKYASTASIVASIFILILLLFFVSLLIFKPIYKVLRWDFTVIYVAALWVTLIGAAMYYSPSFLVAFDGFEFFYEFLMVTFASSMLIVSVPVFIVTLILAIIFTSLDKKNEQIK